MNFTDAQFKNKIKKGFQSEKKSLINSNQTKWKLIAIISFDHLNLNGNDVQTVYISLSHTHTHTFGQPKSSDSLLSFTSTKSTLTIYSCQIDNWTDKHKTQFKQCAMSCFKQPIKVNLWPRTKPESKI